MLASVYMLAESAARGFGCDVNPRSWKGEFDMCWSHPLRLSNGAPLQRSADVFDRRPFTCLQLLPSRTQFEKHVTRHRCQGALSAKS